jgi:hypothetical protein
MKKTKDPVKILEKAAGLLSSCGLAVGEWSNGDGCLCMVGAIHVATKENEPDIWEAIGDSQGEVEALEGLMTYLQHLYPMEDDIAVINDEIIGENLQDVLRGSGLLHSWQQKEFKKAYQRAGVEAACLLYEAAAEMKARR